jgi:hypothetical protein
MNYNERLNNLKSRRSVSQEIINDYIFDSAFRRSLDEKYFSINEDDSVKYAIISMQAVPSKYTKISFEEGERVANSLKKGLASLGMTASHRFQGSVPLDIHIKGVSDVDVLILPSFLTYDLPCESNVSYSPLVGNKSILERMRELRLNSEAILKSKFPAASIFTDKPKAIKLEGGSLRRMIDIVPAHWHDSKKYQISGLEEDREISIYDKQKHLTISNSPFKHMARINKRDRDYSGNLKRVCRLLKNIKADATDKEKKILECLSSYDIAGLVFHMDQELINPVFHELGLLAKVNDYLIKVVANNGVLGRALITPDGSRNIIETEEKHIAAMQLTVLLNSLYSDVLKNLSPFSDEITARSNLINKSLVIE